MPNHAIPKIVKPRFAEVVGLINAVCREHLSDEYGAIAEELTAALARKRSSPLFARPQPHMGLWHQWALVWARGDCLDTFGRALYGGFMNVELTPDQRAFA